MTEIIKETVTARGNNINPVAAAPTGREATSSQTVEYLIYFLFGILETLLVFRLVFKLAGASLSSTFVGVIYSLTGVFILPFEGIFRRGFTQGIETTSVLEPSTLVAIKSYLIEEVK
ncbi:MAG: YggT family protein [bacterium]|nr:YggT family protein [bacterium]